MMECLAAPDAAGLPLHCTGPAGLDALRQRLPPAAAGFLAASGFAARAQEWQLLPGEDGIIGAVLGLGEAPVAPQAFGALAQALPAGSAWRLADPAAHAEAAVLGWCLGAYRFSRFKAPKRSPARLVPPPGTEAAVQAAEAAWRVRDLINTPANLLGPAELAGAAGELAARHGGRCSVIEGEALATGFPALAAVGRGATAARAPRVALLEWGDPAAPLVALCGKGVCFDTGGLDLKPSAGMLRMKKDMGGAAIVLGVAEMVMRARLPVRLLVLIGAVENAVSAEAFRPMDVLRTRAGLTVEVGNTDAEGRLVLCDLLAYAAEQAPALLIDCATLTGAARVALGPDLPALFTPDDGLAETLLAAGRDADDPLWRLPLFDGYDSWLDTPQCDLNNVSSRPMAGAIVAALFLQRFVPRSVRWAHLDIYAWNDAGRPARPEGGEAQAMRALAAGIANMFAGEPAPAP
ncbi:leucyl aminopeptidase family protein [Paeniroseomonas aquatica]|uniref:Leucyl aminopeptidase family protein n=1 Tax=Paeniroseomonas aquatica TaxID=373043 RepID=A0ABT8A9K6_9PROT|nr:leucyl aminopeptidase family protein [Paeniroseomonas aquatica]MDN3566498.1 leucyl aminopeptidase family protein [Paeniroseomonas aquatica]